MFSDLAKIFSRDFLVGFFLPSMIFIAANALMFILFDPLPIPVTVQSLKQVESVWLVSGTVFIAWLLAILLLSANRALVRWLEGYDILEKTPLKWLQEKRFDDLIAKIGSVQQKYIQEQARGHVSRETRREYQRLLMMRRTHFPSEREYLLPTRLGNVIRAFETYSKEMYGLDAIPGWTRIIAVVPKDYRETIADARAQFDFALNLVWLSLIALIEYGTLAWLTGRAPMPIIPLLLVFATWLSYEFAISGAAEWGETVKTVFDLYRNDLLKQMGFDPPKNRDEERDYWAKISRSFLYWEKVDLPMLQKESKNDK